MSADSICKGTTHCKLISATPPNQPIALALGLKLRNTDNLSAYLREITNPASLLYHHYLNAASFAADLATGLGSFDAYKLSQNLNILSQGAPQQHVATSTVWYFAEGRAGGDFQEFLTLENPDPIQVAQVRVQYLFQGYTGPTIMHTVSPQSRYTVNVNGDLHIAYGGPGYAFSMIVYHSNSAWGGTDVVGFTG